MLSSSYCRDAAALCLALATLAPARADFRFNPSVHSRSADGTWSLRQSLEPQPQGTSTTYFPGSITDFAAAAPVVDFFGAPIYALPDAPFSRTTNADSWIGNSDPDDQQRFLIFETYLLADAGGTVLLGVGGDDGHSLFVDDAIVAGASFGLVATHEFTLLPGVRRKLTLALYNGPGNFAAGVGYVFQPTPFSDAVFIGPLIALPGVRLNAKGHFPQVAGVAQVGNLTAPVDRFDALSDGFIYASSFTTGPSQYLLDSITLPAQASSNAAAELRLHAASGVNAPGPLIGSLGVRSAEQAGGGPLTYKSTGVVLQPNTQYWITVGARGNDSFRWDMTFDAQLDAPSSWSIGEYTSFSVDGGDTFLNGKRFGGQPERYLFSVRAEPIGQFLPADFNEDNVVDQVDYALWSAGLGKVVGAAHGDGDANRDGLVDGADFLIWQQQFGAPASSSPVPEPSPAFLAAVAMAVISTTSGHRPRSAPRRVRSRLTAPAPPAV